MERASSEQKATCEQVPAGIIGNGSLISKFWEPRSASYFLYSFLWKEEAVAMRKITDVSLRLAQGSESPTPHSYGE